MSAAPVSSHCDRCSLTPQLLPVDGSLPRGWAWLSISVGAQGCYGGPFGRPFLAQDPPRLLCPSCLAAIRAALVASCPTP